jgi:hypothetical protein
MASASKAPSPQNGTTEDTRCGCACNNQVVSLPTAEQSRAIEFRSQQISYGCAAVLLSLILFFIPTEGVMIV